MYSKLILFISVYFVSISLSAQITVTGQIMRDKNKPVEFCNILVLNTADSSFVSGEIVLGGEIKLKVDQNQFILKIEAIGFGDKYIQIEGSNHLGKILLVANELSTVEVTGQKLPFESQNGNTKINVSNNIFQSSTSTQEILSKSPGVVITNGKISVIGSGDALIYLGRNLITFASMQAIPVSQIESIEVIKNPDASYEAEGKSIILITLKELGLEGIQGALTGHYTKGFYHLGFIDINVNAKKGKWDFNVGANNNYGATGTVRTSYFDVKNGEPYTANTTYKEKVYLPNVYNYLLGAKYQINSKHYISTQFNGNYSKFDLDIENTIDQTIAGQKNSIVTKDIALSYEQSNILSVNYNFTIDSLGSQFFIGATYSSVLVSYSDSVFETTHSNDNNYETFSQSNGKNVNGIGSVQIDYQKKFLNNNQLKIGVKGSNTLSNSVVFLETTSNNLVLNYRNDSFKYDERILSAYTNWSGVWKKGGYQIGLRAEQSKNTALKSQDVKAYLDTNYFSFFPNLGITTKFKNWSMSDQLTSKISRPRYSEITPYIYYINAFSSIYGNPQIKPSFVYNYEHKFSHKKTSFGIGYNYTKAPRTFINLQGENGESTNVMKVVNLDKLEKIYAEVRKSSKVSFFYNFSMVNVSYSKYTSDVYDFGDIKTSPQVYAYTYNRIGIKDWFDFEVIGKYTSSFSNGKRTLRAQGEIDLGISKSFADGKGFAQITVNDIFQTAKPSPFAYVDNDYYSSTVTQDSRYLRVFVSYRFGKLKVANYNHLNIDENEIQRAK